MISMYSGTPGSGKSLNVARQICIWLKIKRRVISTMEADVRLCFLNKFSKLIFSLTKGKVLLFDVDDERMKNFYYINIFDLTPKYLIDFAMKNHKPGKEKQTLLIVDECVSIFSPEKCQGQFWLDWQFFFQYHRHFGYEVILVPQNTELLARKVKHFAEFEVRHRAIKNAGFFGSILSKLCGGLFSTKTFWQGSNNKKHIDKEWFRYHYIYGKMYNSYSMFYEMAEKFNAEKDKKEESKPLTYKQKKAVDLCNALTFRIYQLKQNEVITND